MPELGDTEDSEFSGSGSFGSPPDPFEGYEGEEPGQEEAAPQAPESASEARENPPGGGPTPSPDRALEEAPSSEETDVETLEAFADTYRISETDAGFTPAELFEEMQDGEDREPNELDEEILDGLIMRGYYEREFEIGSSTFRLRSSDPNVSHNVVRVLQEVLGDDEPVTQSVRNPMLVSQHLSYFQGEQLPGAGANETFSSRDALKSRFAFCMEMATPILDGIGSRVNAFRSRVGDATERSMANF